MGSNPAPPTFVKSQEMVPDLGLGLVVAAWVEDEFANQRTVFADDTDVFVGDQDVDGEACMSPAQADVVEAAEVAQGDAAGLIDAVVTDAEMG